MDASRSSQSGGTQPVPPHRLCQKGGTHHALCAHLQPPLRGPLRPPLGLRPQPGFYDYEEVGGDCTNFASQCVYAGSGVMNFTPDLLVLHRRQPEGARLDRVEYFWNFMTRREISQGPVGVPCELGDLRPGDLVQLSFSGEGFQHTPVVVAVRRPIRTLEDVLIAAHSYDADNRPLSTYTFQDIRFLHVLGTIRP